MTARPSEISWALKEQIRQHGAQTAMVTTARPMSDAQVGRLKQALGNQVNVRMRTDPAILGGMIVKLGSRMIDDSVRSKLDRMEMQMKDAV